jgi:hypothetical protein
LRSAWLSGCFIAATQTAKPEANMNTKHILAFAIAAGAAYYLCKNNASAYSWPVVNTIYSIGYNYGAGNGFSTTGV